MDIQRNKKVIAIYPGSFDPVTNGHLDLIARAAMIFDKVVVAVTRNPDKDALFEVKERVEMLEAVTFDWKNEKVTDDISNRDAKFDTLTYSVRDLWLKKDLGTTKTPLSAAVQGHDVLVVRLDKI